MLKKLLLLLFFLAFFTASYAEEKRYSVPLEGSPVYGPAKAAVTMIEFLDYQ